jgi:paraquat-inducible protein B
MNEGSSQSNHPLAKVKRHSRFSPIWLVPLVAAGLVVYLGYNAFTTRGPELVLTMKTADGLTVDETQLKHKAVPLGTVEHIELAPDMKSVVVKVRMSSNAKSILTDHARFWVVRPRLSAGNLSGIETLVSGAYIEVDPGAPGGRKQREFQALENPPGRQSDEPGQVYVLSAQSLGPLSAGSPIYFRDVEVGQVLSYDLGKAMGPVSMRVFVREPYDKFVHPETRFWNVSGLSLSMGPEGMHLELQSLQSLLSGGIAFETPRGSEANPPAPESASFPLYPNKAMADAASYRENVHCVTYFTTSVQGLTVGSPVQLFGVQVGIVTDVKLVNDAAPDKMIARVAFNLQPERVLGGNARSEQTESAVAEQVNAAFTQPTMRVMLESSSLLTGTKDLALLYDPSSMHRGEPRREGDAIVLPSQGGGLDAITATVSDVAAKVDKIPFESIGQNANLALASIHHLATQVDTNATPALAQLPAIADQLSQATKNAQDVLGAGGYGPNSAFQHDMTHLMSEVNDAARSFRVLADYLDRHPEALIKGRGMDVGER